MQWGFKLRLIYSYLSPSTLSDERHYNYATIERIILLVVIVHEITRIYTKHVYVINAQTCNTSHA